MIGLIKKIRERRQEKNKETENQNTVINISNGSDDSVKKHRRHEEDANIFVVRLDGDNGKKSYGHHDYGRHYHGRDNYCSIHDIQLSPYDNRNWRDGYGGNGYNNGMLFCFSDSDRPHHDRHKDKDVNTIKISGDLEGKRITLRNFDNA